MADRPDSPLVNPAGAGMAPSAEEPSAERARLIGQEAPDEALPRVYVARRVMEFIEGAARRAGADGAAGFLMGRALRNPRGRRFVLIDGCIEAPEVESAGRSVKLTPRAWKALRSAASSAFEGREVIGWFHARPGEPPHLSPYETFVQQTHFGAAWQVALVYDPDSGQHAWWGWHGEALERLGGFWLWETPSCRLMAATELQRLALFEPAEAATPPGVREAAAAAWQRGTWPTSRAAQVAARRRHQGATGRPALAPRWQRVARVLQGVTVLVLVFVGAMLARWGLEQAWPYVTGRPAPWMREAVSPVVAGPGAPVPGASPGAPAGDEVIGGGPTTPAVPTIASRPVEGAPPPTTPASPTSDAPAPPAAAGVPMMERYRVQRGDTLWLIAQRFYGDPTAYTLIAQANGLSDPHRLVAGQELLLPPLDGETPGRK